MKRKIIIALCAAALLLLGVGGGVYAANHTPLVKGYKIVGIGHSGTSAFGDQFDTWFWFTNPDCVNKITVTRVSVMRNDGSVIYSGPYISVPPPGTGDRTVYNPLILNPHQVAGIPLADYMYTGAGDDPTDYTDPDNWLTRGDALALGRAQYTVEINYIMKKATICHLRGWWHAWYTPSGGTTYPTEGEMINMTQGN